MIMISAKKLTLASYAPSADDFALLDKLSAAPNAKNGNVLRWWNHISSFAEERASIVSAAPAASRAAPAKVEEEDDDDIDLFGDDDDEEAEKIREEMIEQRAQEQLAKNALKDKPVAKSSILFDVKPWDSETDLKVLEGKIREIELEGLLWGASEFKPVAFGINKITIMCTIVDDLVSSDILQERIEEFEDEVQSVDVVSFTKI
jgi:elongation factor 1-beta